MSTNPGTRCCQVQNWVFEDRCSSHSRGNKRAVSHESFPTFRVEALWTCVNGRPTSPDRKLRTSLIFKRVVSARHVKCPESTPPVRTAKKKTVHPKAPLTSNSRSEATDNLPTSKLLQKKALRLQQSVQACTRFNIGILIFAKQLISFVKNLKWINSP